MSPNDANMYYKPTPLPQTLIHEPIWDLPSVKPSIKALDPSLKHIRAPQLLRNDTQRRSLLTIIELANRRTRGVQRLNKRVVVYAVARYQHVNGA